MREMPSRLLTEWMAFFSIEEEERLERELKAKAQIGEAGMRSKRGKK